MSFFDQYLTTSRGLLFDLDLDLDLERDRDRDLDLDFRFIAFFPFLLALLPNNLSPGVALMNCSSSPVKN